MAPMYIARCVIASYTLCLLTNCNETGSVNDKDQKKRELRQAIKSTKWNETTDSIIHNGMSVSEVEGVIGPPDTSYWTQDSFFVYLYYNSIEGINSTHTPLVLFNRWKESILSTTNRHLYFDNSLGTVHRDTSIKINLTRDVYTDTNGVFIYEIHSSRYELLRTWQVDKEIWSHRKDEGGVDSVCVFEKISGKPIQTILVSENHNYPGSYSPLNFEDFNFDGFADFAILQNNFTANICYLYWLYNPPLGKFEESKELEAVTSAKFDHGKKAITSFWRGSSCDHGRSTYRYINGKLVLVSVVEETCISDDSLYHTVKRRINGKMQLVSSKYLKDSELY